jgi:pimeloyl-ACP methyl ester carboxylesterase
MATGLTPRVLEWCRAGEFAELDGRRIFVRAQAGDGPAVLLLHGYPSSSYDWRRVFGLLPSRRLVTFDFLGYGLSDKPRDHVYSLLGQADLVQEVVARHYAGEPVVLVAHDMGSSVATEVLARDVEGRLPFELERTMLFNASLVLEQASLLLGQKLLRSRLGPVFARLTNERSFKRSFGGIFSAAHPLSAEEAADQWALLANGGGHRILDKLIYYLHERIAFAPRWHGALRDWQGHLELAWAGLDPICTEAVLQAVLALRPDVPLTRLPELGHYPQLEDPAAATEVIEMFARDSSID